MDEIEADAFCQNVLNNFAGRHRDIQQTFKDHFNKINEEHLNGLLQFHENKKLLLGALFTMEYSIKSAALFNPSIVAHPNQQNLQPGELRFIMSLRATGEGHISSIIFQTGTINENGDIVLDKEPEFFTRLNIKAGTDTDHANYELESSPHLPMNEKVIFPNTEAEKKGMEDVRFVKFEHDGNSCYYGTYTAYNGHDIKTQLIETTDFNDFKIRTLKGAAISDKGMALFPEKINDKYVMISRQGGESIHIMFSDDLYTWENSRLLMEPKYTWEFVQLGNCGSPIKTDKGWLLLTHAVGPVRTYVISAILLDLHDPTKIIGRLSQPFIHADETEREGYVPNVVYTCGLLRHHSLLLIPYAVSDSATGFATIMLDTILTEMNL
jgi:predicted GH43/DUF377 family glycosyl hydrolase